MRRGRAQVEDLECAAKLGICHFTGSEKNPYEYIEVCVDAVPAHAAHGDLVACPPNFLLDPDTCTCICPLEADDCPAPFALDPDICACFCPLTAEDCPGGVDLELCECIESPNPECAGASCGNFVQCASGNPDCVCVTVEPGTGGLCVPGSTACAGLAACPDFNCPEGELCAVNTCCPGPVCVPVALECAADATASAAAAAVTDGPTIASR